MKNSPAAEELWKAPKVALDEPDLTYQGAGGGEDNINELHLDGVEVLKMF